MAVCQALDIFLKEMLFPSSMASHEDIVHAGMARLFGRVVEDIAGSHTTPDELGRLLSPVPEEIRHLARPDLVSSGTSSEDRRAALFFALQRFLLAPLVGEERASAFHDYHEAGGPPGLLEIITPKPFIEAYFVAHVILGPLAERLECYYVPLASQQKDDAQNNPRLEAGRQAYRDLHHYFDSTVLYSATTFPYALEDLTTLLPPPHADPHADVLDTKANFFVLRRAAVAPDEAPALLERARAIQHILSYSTEFYRLRASNPWKDLLSTVEGLMVRLDPHIPVDFANRGRIMGYTDADPEGYHPEGLYVEDQHEYRVILSNTGLRERFSPLIGQTAVYRVNEDSLELTAKLLVVE